MIGAKLRIRMDIDQIKKSAPSIRGALSYIIANDYSAMVTRFVVSVPSAARMRSI